MNKEETNFTFRGAFEEYSLPKAVRRVLQEGDGDVESLTVSVAYLLSAILESLPEQEVVRILNAGSIHTWEAKSYGEDTQ